MQCEHRAQAWREGSVIGSASSLARGAVLDGRELVCRSRLRENLEKRVLPLFVGRVLPFDLTCTQVYAKLMAKAREVPGARPAEENNMCEDHYESDMNEYLRRVRLTRRTFGALSTGVGMAMLFPRAANARDVTESEVNIKTPDGTADCYFVRPSSGAHAGVVIWPDILGLRPAFRQMGQRLAESGYSVLVVNPFYRQKHAPVVPDGSSFADEGVRNTVMPLAQGLNPTTHVTDAKAFVAWLDSQAAVDKNRKIGTMGYCMGGPITMRTAASVPERVGAGASFHGGGLVTDGPDSPHLLVPQMKAQYLFAIAANDDERQPEAKDALRKAFADADLPAEIEVYAGTMHGWCPPDSGVYNEEQAERAWSRMLVLFEKALA